MDPLAAARQRAAANREQKGQVLPMARILALPREDLEPVAEELADKWTANLRKHPNAPRLNAYQGMALETIYRSKHGTPEVPAWSGLGMLANIPVGGGKTLTALLADRVLETERMIYMFPPDLRSTIKAERYKWSKHYYLANPLMVPYSTLSRQDASSLLRQKAPKAIFADEVQTFRNFNSARTRRLIRFMRANPECRLYGVTGTLSKGSLLDFAYLLALALREGTPTPLLFDPNSRAPQPFDEVNLLKMWASVADEDGEPDEEALQATYELVAQYRPRIELPDFTGRGPTEVAREEMRQALYHRMKDTRGIILGDKSSCDAAIVMTGINFEMGSDQVSDAMGVLAEKYELPDGTTFADATQVARAAIELSMGFYYTWDWPNGVVDEEWMEHRRNWAKAVRTYLSMWPQEGRDSEGLVEKWVRAYLGDPEFDGPPPDDDLIDTLLLWDTVRHRPQPPTKAVWLDYTPILKAVEWAHNQPEEENVFIWFKSKAVGTMLEALGIKVMRSGSGQPDPNVRVHALSTTIYHKGWNLQEHWRRQLVMEPSSSPIIWQQKMGRTHRSGQRHDTVFFDVYQHNWRLRQQMSRAIAKARVNQSLLAEPQKLLMANKTDIGFRPFEEEG